jgi:hypothetical protein
MLTIADRKKKREAVDFADALCKALGWYFPLLAKMQVKSAEMFAKITIRSKRARDIPVRRHPENDPSD